MKHSTLFLDESGKSSLAEKENEPFVLTGVILDDEEINPVEGFFNYIKRKYGIDPSKPFHSYDIFENPTTKLSAVKAKALVATLADFLSLIPVKVNIVSIDKSDFKKALGVKSNDDFKGSSERKEVREYPYRIMSAFMFKWFGSYLNKTKGIGQILVDSRRGGDYQLLKSLNLCKDPKGPLTAATTKIIREKCNAICFAEKYFLSGGLEITDLISYTSFFNTKATMNSMDKIRLNSIWSPIKKRLKRTKIYKITDSEIKQFFRVDTDGVHKCLKT